MISGCKYFLKWHTIVHAKSSSVYKHSKVLLYHKCSISLPKKKKVKKNVLDCQVLGHFVLFFLQLCTQSFSTRHSNHIPKISPFVRNEL